MNKIIIKLPLTDNLAKKILASRLVYRILQLTLFSNATSNRDIINTKFLNGEV